MFCFLQRPSMIRAGASFILTANSMASSTKHLDTLVFDAEPRLIQVYGIGSVQLQSMVIMHICRGN
jgi:hypothetical protein